MVDSLHTGQARVSYHEVAALSYGERVIAMVERIYAIAIMLFGLAVFGSALRRTLQREPASKQWQGGMLAPSLLAVGCLIAGVTLWIIAAE